MPRPVTRPLVSRLPLSDGGGPSPATGSTPEGGEERLDSGVGWASSDAGPDGRSGGASRRCGEPAGLAAQRGIESLGATRSGRPIGSWGAGRSVYAVLLTFYISTQQIGTHSRGAGHKK